MYSASYTDLQTMIPGIDTNPDNINPGGKVPIYFNDQVTPTGTTITLCGPQWSSGLSKRVVALPAGFSKFTFSYQIRVSQTAALFGQAQENDLMIVDPAGNRYNGSMRKNNQTGGQWEIAKENGDWAATGFKPGPFAPDTWVSVAVTMQADWTKKALSVLTIVDGSQTFNVPQNLQNVPATPNSGWQPSIVDWQSQETLLKDGAMTRDMRAVNLQLA